MLLSRIVHATEDSETCAELKTGAIEVVPAQEQAAQAFAAPVGLPDRTTECLVRMSPFQQRQVLALMHQTHCFTGDFALAFLAATPVGELSPEFQPERRDGRCVASLVRYEHKLQMAVRITCLLAREHPLRLVERALHFAFGRQLLSQPAVRTWLKDRAPDYVKLLQEAGAIEGPGRESRRPIRVAG